ncbi:L-tyrosine 3-hydroxylase [Streptomyces sp. NPDC091272]|uniref:L-tyrosine 3-hydroxylase n=1 Tax=Streptomyces sp. NPDC091272 TaxID=3365981 RepID=UPI0038253C07
MSTLDVTSTAGLLESGVIGFGGRAYGLEPLVLPTDPVHARGDGELAWRYAELLGPRPAPAQGPPAGPGAADSAEQLFWFRWITGHQLTFMLWQELARRAVRAAAPAPGQGQARAPAQAQPLSPSPAQPLPPASAQPLPPAPDGMLPAARLVRGYSAMLLYTASCTREVYHRVIRPSMALHHPAFSGAWARDYGPVRALLRGRPPAARAGGADALLAECALNTAVHEGIALKLVPDAPSLLQSAAGQDRPLPRDIRAVLFDTYFLTLRAPCSPAEVAAQLLRRIRAVSEDLTVNGLYPAYASSRAEKPAALCAGPVEEIEHGVPGLLAAIARDAVLRPTPDPSDPGPATSARPLEGSDLHGT